MALWRVQVAICAFLAAIAKGRAGEGRWGLGVGDMRELFQRLLLRRRCLGRGVRRRGVSGYGRGGGSARQVGLVLYRLEDIVGEGGGIFLEEIGNLLLEQLPDGVGIAFVAKKRENVIGEDVGVGIGSEEQRLSSAQRRGQEPRAGLTCWQGA